MPSETNHGLTRRPWLIPRRLRAYRSSGGLADRNGEYVHMSSASPRETRLGTSGKGWTLAGMAPARRPARAKRLARPVGPRLLTSRHPRASATHIAAKDDTSDLQRQLDTASRHEHAYQQQHGHKAWPRRSKANGRAGHPGKVVACSSMCSTARMYGAVPFLASLSDAGDSARVTHVQKGHSGHGLWDIGLTRLSLAPRRGGPGWSCVRLHVEPTDSNKLNTSRRHLISSAHCSVM